MLLPRLLFLNFHGLGEPPAQVSVCERPYWVPVSVFRETLQVLADLDRSSDVDVRITFDDGYRSDTDIAVPLLLEHGRQAEFFVLSGRIGRSESLSGNDLREMRRLGFAIGSHGVDHIRWSTLDDDRLDHELQSSKARIEDILGHAIDGAAGPFGSFDRRVVRRAMAAGYRRIFSTRGGFTWKPTGFIPRFSARVGFSPRHDIPLLLRPSERMLAAARDSLRRIRYGTRMGTAMPIGVWRQGAHIDRGR